MAKQSHSLDLLDLKPMRIRHWESRDDQLITVLVPKFQNRWLVRWLMPRLAKPDFRVRLDALGSYIWQRCDGSLTVREIAESVSEEFQKETDPDFRRMALFVHRLACQELIQLNGPEAPAPSASESKHQTSQGD